MNSVGLQELELIKEVKQLVLLRRGEGRGSMLQGSSVHNQRIERLYRDMRKMVTDCFRHLFYFLENNALLDATSEIDLAALHFVFMPRINNSLEKFKASWNNHKLSTENQKTLNQLYILGSVASLWFKLHRSARFLRRKHCP